MQMWRTRFAFRGTKLNEKREKTGIFAPLFVRVDERELLRLEEFGVNLERD